MLHNNSKEIQIYMHAIVKDINREREIKKSYTMVFPLVARHV